MKLPEIRKVASKYEVTVSKKKGTESTYYAHSFPYAFPAPMKDFIEAHFTVTNSDTYSVTFII